MIDALTSKASATVHRQCCYRKAKQHFKPKGEPWVRQAKPGKSARPTSKSTKLAASKSIEPKPEQPIETQLLDRRYYAARHVAARTPSRELVVASHQQHENAVGFLKAR